MKSLIVSLPFLLLITACSHSYYIVRHAEKSVPSAGTTMSTPNDPPLSTAGEERAQALAKALEKKTISYIYSTNTIRTKSTAEPVRQGRDLTLITYGPVPDQAFITTVKGIKQNVLIVGHSNTVDDIVNGLTGAKTIPADLADSEYDNLFVVTYRKFLGTRIKYRRLKYGVGSGSVQ